MMKQWDFGVIVRLPVVIVDSGGTAVDPTEVYLAYTAIALGVATTYTYSVSGITRTAAGHYYVDIDTRESSGEYKWRFYSTGTYQAAVTGKFYVHPNEVN